MSTAIVAALVYSFCQVLIFGALVLCLRAWAAHKQAEIEHRIDAVLRDWFTPEAEGEPHKAAKAVAAMGEVVGAAAARSIMASLSADRSHVARAANGAAEELQAVQNPVLGLLTGGRRGKGAALRQLAAALGPMLAGGGIGGPPDNGSNPGGSSSVRDRLKHQQ